MRRAIFPRTLAATLVVLLAAAGCVTTGSLQSKDSEPLTILTHYGNDPQKSALQQYVDEWNNEHPDNPVRTQAVSFENLLQTIMVRQAAGQTPDIIQAYSLWAGQLVDANVLADVPDDVATDVRRNYSDAATALVTMDDRVIGYPSEVQTYALFYNKRLLAEAGFDQPPGTWDELEKIARQTTVRDSSGNIQVTGFGLESGAGSAVVHPFLALMDAAGGRYLTKDGSAVTLDSAAGVEALELQRRLIRENVSDPGGAAISEFTSGKAAMVISAGWWIGSLKATMGDDYADVGVAPIPGPGADDRGSLSYGYFTGVNAQSDQKQGAWEFLRWLNAERQKSGATRMGSLQFSLGSLPGRESDARELTSDLDDPNYGPFLDALEYAMPEPNLRHGAQMKTTLQTHIESVWTGEASAAESLSRVADAANASLERERK